MGAARGLDVPGLVRQRAFSSGSVGERWLRALPAVLDGLSERWLLQFGRPTVVAPRATSSPPATSGLDVVLKMAMPLDDG